jgi:hypothetical protein
MMPLGERIPPCGWVDRTDTMQLHTLSREQVETGPLPGPSAIVCMADSPEQLAAIRDEANVVTRLNLIFNDAREPFELVSPPTEEHARTLLDFARSQIEKGVPHLVLQCQVGIGRSHGACAALLKISGVDPSPILFRGTYNRLLYRRVLAAAGLKPDKEPLVSMAIRVKYVPERLNLFLLSMKCQRYENWEVVAVTDGPNPQAASLIASLGLNQA